MKLVDLHTHTTASDGSMSPSELVKYAAGKGLAAIAVTDHDTLDGIEEAAAEGNNVGVEVIAGVEISVDFEPEMHMLGYFMNAGYKAIVPIIDELKKKRDERNPKIVEKLRKLGFDITLEEAAEQAGGKIVGRPHMAAVLVKHGYAESIGEAFDKYLASGKPAFVKKGKMTPEEGIKAILNAGGIPVLAHPVLLDMGWNKLDSLFAKLAAYGLKGAEAIYVENTDEQTGILIELCRKYKLAVTGGSDFHGKFKPDIDIGIGKGNLAIPYEVVEQLKKII